MAKSGAETVFVRLFDDGVDVWRPILATHLRGDVYRVTEQPQDATETWEYEPGAEVRPPPVFAVGPDFGKTRPRDEGRD